jgi:hypothetical protein
MMVPRASHMTLIVVRNRSLGKGKKSLRKAFVTLKALESSQQPVDGDDNCDILSGQANGIQHHDHRDETSLRNACGTNRGGSCGDANREEESD